MKANDDSDASDPRTKLEHLRPGQPAPCSGQSELVGPDGKRTGEEQTIVRGEPLPPTPLAGMHKTVRVNLTRDQVSKGPEYDPSATAYRAYEEWLYQHYGNQRY